MAKSSFESVDEYIASQPEAVQGILELVRETIRKALPKAEEVISYNIAAYKLDGRAVIYFAAWKQHYSLYPATGRVIAEFNDELVPYKVLKSTLRLPYSAPVPVALIRRIAKFRAKEEAERRGSI